MENAQVAAIFEKIADLLELQGGNEYRVRSYRNAARTVKDHSARVADMVRDGEDLESLPNIGESTAEKIAEIVERGTCARLEELEKKVPEQLTAIMEIPGLGAKKAQALHEGLGIETVAQLETACREHRVRDLEGMGAKTEENILAGIATRGAASGRTLLRDADEQVAAVARLLEDRDEVDRWRVAGSFRRRKETVGDLDILVASADREATTAGVREGGIVTETIDTGAEKVSVRLENGLQVDVRYFEEDSFGAALLYFTGSKDHNIAVRRRAVDRDWKLNEYGLFAEDDTRVAGKTEEEVYGALSMDWIPPALREDRGEVAAAAEGRLPALVDRDDIRGDLHCHTTATDGQNTIAEMAAAGRERGYDYLAISDHSRAVSVAGGLDEDGLRKHADAIRDVDADSDDIRILAGVEVDILKDGSLDIAEDVLAELDWVTASIHYHFNLDEKKMTERLVAAVRSGVVHCLGHPFAREIGTRDPLRFDVDRVFEECGGSGVCLEINARPERLDTPDIYCRRGTEAGVSFVIDTDAHRAGDLDLMRFGVDVARRGWLEKKHVLNTRALRQIEKHFGR